MSEKDKEPKPDPKPRNEPQIPGDRREKTERPCIEIK